MLNKLKDHWVEIIMIKAIMIFILFVVGYLAKGFWGKPFDVAQCWVGLAAVSAVSVTGLGKYAVDSKYNSAQGEKPDGKG